MDDCRRSLSRVGVLVAGLSCVLVAAVADNLQVLIAVKPRQ